MSSSSSTSALTTCCICLSKMNAPIRTLPCLHSSCASCIDQLITKSKKPFKCPQCRSPFDAPPSSSSSSSSASASASLEANYFTSRLLASVPGGSSVQDDFDPNDIKCGFCDENEAAEYCKDCPMFYCTGCKRGHLRLNANAHHQFVSIEEGLIIKSGGSGPSGSSSSPTRCYKHPQQEVNSYCEKCQEACCSECAIDNHSSHGVIRLSSLSERFKGEISTLMNKVKNYDHSLSQAIKETTNVLVGLKKQGKLTEEHVHRVFNQLRLQLDEREAELIADIDQEMHQKEKELMIQKDELEFLLKGIRDSVEFSDRLVRDGNGVEIVMSHKPVVGRFQTLENEMKGTPLIPVTDEVIEFLGGESLVAECQKVVNRIGGIVVKGVISAEKSRVVRNSGNEAILVGQNYSFDLMVVDQKGNPLNGVAQLGAIEVKIDGPSKDVKVDCIDHAGDKEGKGGSSGSFELSEVGDHEISILFRGRHFQGSPFKLKVIDKPIYRRDYGLIGENQQPIVRFGSKGSGDGQFYSPHCVACNSRGEIIVADTNNNRMQVFDKTGRFLFKFGSYGKGNGQFSSPFGVTVDHRNQNQIVVADGDNCRIQIFDEKGGFLRSFGSYGNGDGQFTTPTGIAVDQSNGNYNYFVADHSNHRVQNFDSNGQFIRKFGSQGNGNGHFNNPWGMGLLSNGNLVVIEWTGSRLQIFDSTGNFIRVIPGFRTPGHLFIDSDDNILVAEYGGQQVRVFRENGNQVRAIGKGQLSGPTGVCLDDQERIIVCECGGNRISIF